MNIAAAFCYGLGALVAGVLITLGVQDLRWPAHPDETFAVLVTGSAAALVGLIAVGAAIYGTFTARKIARLQATLEHLSSNEQDRTLQNAHLMFNRIVNTRRGAAHYAEERFEGSKETQAITTVCNEYELISIGIQLGIVDPQLFSRWCKSNVIYTWNNAEPFVVALRKRAQQPSLYYEFQELARWISQDRLPHRRFWWLGI